MFTCYTLIHLQMYMYLWILKLYGDGLDCPDRGETQEKLSPTTPLKLFKRLVIFYL